MNIFITGSSGFIGKHLIEKLTNRKNMVTGYDVAEPAISNESFEHISGDICDKDNLINALNQKKHDVIIHLAAKHHDFGVSEEEFFEVNERGTKNLIEAADVCGVKNFLFFSSVAVYGDRSKPVMDDAVCEPTSFYGKSKLAAEKVLEEWTDADNERAVNVIRPVVVFGPENYANMYHLISKIANKKFIFIGKGSNVKSIAYVENVVNAALFLLDNMAPGISYYNYSDEPQMPIKEIVKKIAKYAGVKIPGFQIPLFPALVLTYPFDLLEKTTGRIFPITAKRIRKFNTPTHYESKKIRTKGFRQTVSADEAFEKTLKWFTNRDNNV
ncbi:MAG: NAD(P)-dependent oxidoreductase [Candidatus Omnitrophica bacterium]|nr:NAD(P)-dependent oxidoreductase [Candidatus Omnitrophota bacterium]